MTSAPSFRLLPVEATEAMIEAMGGTPQMRAISAAIALADNHGMRLPLGNKWNTSACAEAYRAAVSAAPVMGEATDEMVDAACDAYWGTWQKLSGPVRDSMRDALNAALAIAAGQLGEKKP